MMQKNPQKRVYIQSFGCQMNAHDAERMADLLSQEGYESTDQAAEADLVILNTCHIREKASEKVYSELGRLQILKKERQDRGQEAFIAVAGCIAQAEGEEIIRRQKAVDLVVGPQSYHNLPTLLQKARERGRKRTPSIVDIDFPEIDKFAHLPPPLAKRVQARGASAFLTVQEGCDKFCAFCVVPFTRGAEKSRPVAEVVKEAQALVAVGVQEIMLLGQNVNAYHGEGAGGKAVHLAELFTILSDIEGLKRLRYATSHPCDMDEALLLAHRDNSKVMPYLHLPVQSGSDAILKAMNRRHTSDFYKKIIDKARHLRPDIAISSDFIVGFPGESDFDFAQTMDLVQEIGFASAYSFKYSARPGTKSAEGADDVPEVVKNERLYALQHLLLKQQTAFNQACIGKVVEVLFEKPGRHAGQMTGKSPYLQAVHVELPESLPASSVLGRILPVKLLSITSNSLHGEIIGQQGGLGDAFFAS